MYGELTDKETVARVEYALEHQQHDQFEILLYKKNSKFFAKYEILSGCFSEGEHSTRFMRSGGAFLY